MSKKSFIAGLFLLAFIAIPLSSLAQTPAVTNGLNWLSSAQRVDGHWPGDSSEEFLATTTATEALFLLTPAALDYSRGVEWLEGHPVSPTDLLARRIVALSDAGRDTSAEVAQLLALRDDSGGWGGDDGYRYTTLDSALALRALRAAGVTDSAILYPAIRFLTQNQNLDGGWGVYPGTANNSYVSALVLQTLAPYRATYPVQGNLDQGIVYLLTTQNPDGGFGGSPSTSYETALALIALVEDGQTQGLPLQKAVDYLAAEQQPNGSWNDDPYCTALALQALAYVKPDLAIQAGDLAASTTSPLEGEPLTLTATVRNLGLEPAATALVRLLDGDTVVGEQTVTDLGPGATTTVTFTIETLAPVGEHLLKVQLDPAGALPELREENNSVTLRLWATARPDLAVLPEYLSLSAASPRPGETVTLTAWVANLGETPVAQATAELYDGDPAAGGIKLGTFTLYGLSAGGWGEGSLTFTLDGVGEHTLTLVVDPQGAIFEQSETNNVAAQTVTVREVGAGGDSVDLLIPVDGLRIDPDRPRSGEAATVIVQALNLGMEATAAELELFDGDPQAGGVLLHRETLALSPGQTATVSVPWQAEGIHSLHAFIDRGNQIAELDESNNHGELPVMFDMVDIQVSATDLAIEPSQPMAGDSATVAVIVHNRGILPTGPFSVTLHNGDPVAGGSLLETFAVSELAGDGEAVLTYALAAERGNYRFYVTCDADHAVPELFEGNNTAIRSLSVKTSEEAQGPDLVPFALDLAGTTQNAQTLRLEGPALVKIQNKGDDKVTVPFKVVIFEDRDGDGLFSAGTDKTLGSGDYSLPMWPNGVALAMVPLAGTLSFRDAPIYAAVDTEQVVFEQNEANNLLRRGTDCEARPLAPIQMKEKWEWRGGNTGCATSHVTPPIVVNLNDSNSDGKIDGTDTAAILSVNTNPDWCPGGPMFGKRGGGLLQAVNGKTGQTIFSVGGAPYQFEPGQYLAAGDLNADGFSEVVVAGYGANNWYGLYTFDHNGNPLWQNSAEVAKWTLEKNIYNLYLNGPLSIADLNADGKPEIITGASVTNADGSVKWGGYSRQIPGRGDSGSGIFQAAVVADLNMDGTQEVVAGNAAYRQDGSVLWLNAAVPDGLDVIGNFDEDPFPEVVLWTRNNGYMIYLLEHDGTIKWGPVTLESLEGINDIWHVFGGPPTIADFDGDGQREIGIKGYNYYHVLDKDGRSKIAYNITPGNYEPLAATVFDLNGDGTPEVIFRSGDYLQIYNGKSGQKLQQVKVGSASTQNAAIKINFYSNLVIADVDSDGQAEIVTSGVDWGWYANNAEHWVRVYEAKNNDWIDTRSIWNQASYHVTNVNDDGTIPRYEAPSWLLNNSYHANVPVSPPTGSPYRAADLSASYVRVAMADFPGAVALSVRIGNGGALPAPMGVPVAFYDGDPQAGGVLIGTAATSRDLDSGEYEDVTLIWNAPPAGRHTLFIRADNDGAVEECDKANNDTALEIVLSNGGIIEGGLPDLGVSATDIALPPTVAEGSLVAVGLTVRNLGSEPVANAVLRLFVGDPARGGRQLGDDRTIAYLGAGETTTVTIPWSTLGYLGTNYLYALVDPDGAIAEANEENNTALQLVLVAPALQPDLALGPEGITLSPAAPAEGDLLALAVTVQNLGTAVAGVPAVLYDGDPAAGGTKLGEVSINPSIPFGGSAAATFSLDTVGFAGNHTLVVVLDPDNRIDEADESNNRAVKALTVAPVKLALSLTTDQGGYGSNQPVLCNLRVAELSATDRLLTYDVRVTDGSGQQVATVVLNEPLSVGANAVVDKGASWNTGTTLSGDYLLSVTLKEGGRVVARATAPFALVPEKAVQVSVAPEQAGYSANAAVTVAAAVVSESSNYLFADLVVRVAILDPQGAELFAANRSVPLLTPGQRLQIPVTWNTGAQTSGIYRLRAEAYEGDNLLGAAESAFEILSSATTFAGITGAIAMEQAVIEYGEAGRIHYAVANRGNEALTAYDLVLLIADPETSAVLVETRRPAAAALAAGASQGGDWILETAGLGLKNYLAIVQLEVGSLRQSLAAAVFRVKDETPPDLVLLSPSADEIYRTGVPVTVRAIDPASGIDRVEYRLDDQADWLTLAPAAGVVDTYAAHWETTFEDDGRHTLQVRAFDHAGNQSVTAPVAFEVVTDSTPPETRLDLGEPRFQTAGGPVYLTVNTLLTLTASDDLSGVQATTYRFDAETAWRAYDVAFGLAALGFGDHTVYFRSVDKAGNQEAEKSLAVTLIGIEVTAETLNPPRVLVWAGEPKTKEYSFNDIRALIAEALVEPAAFCKVTQDKVEFQDEFHSDRYNMVFILDQAVPLPAPLLREIRGRVADGMGLLVANWGNAVHPILQEALGVDFRGSLPMAAAEHGLYLYPGPLSEGQSLLATGRVLKTTLAGGDLAGIVVGDNGCRGIAKVALSFPVALAVGDMVTATLYQDRNGEKVVVDEERHAIDRLPAAPTCAVSGDPSGDMALESLSADSATVSVAAPFGILGDNYAVAVRVEHPDGSSSGSGAVDFHPNCAANLQNGVLLGPFRIVTVDEDHAAGRGDVPAIVLGHYGKGQTVFISYDLVGSALQAHRQQQADMVRRAAGHLLPKAPLPGIGSLFLVETRVKVDGAGLDLAAVESLGEGWSQRSLFGLDQEVPTFRFHLQDGAETSYRYFVETDTAIGPFSKTTDLYLEPEGGPFFFDHYPFTLTIPLNEP